MGNLKKFLKKERGGKGERGGGKKGEERRKRVLRKEGRISVQDGERVEKEKRERRKALAERATQDLETWIQRYSIL